MVRIGRTVMPGVLMGQMTQLKAEAVFAWGSVLINSS
jgi:hypothetical protein